MNTWLAIAAPYRLSNPLQQSRVAPHDRDERHRTPRCIGGFIASTHVEHLGWIARQGRADQGPLEAACPPMTLGTERTDTRSAPARPPTPIPMRIPRSRVR